MQDVRKWYEVAKKHADENCQYMLLSNKWDFTIKYPRMKQVPNDDLRLLWKEIGGTFGGEWSAKSNINISKPIDKLVRKVYAVQLHLVKEGVKKEKELKVDYETALRSNDFECVIF